MDKEQFLQRLQHEQNEWEHFLMKIPHAQRQLRNLYGKWSVQDVVGHVTAWERYLTGRLRAHLHGIAATPQELWGEFVPPGDLEDDALNEWMADQLKEHSFDEIVALQRNVRARLISTVQTMNEAALLAIGVKVRGLPDHAKEPFWQVIASMSYNHAQAHQAGLQQALVQQTQSAQHFDHGSVTALHQQMLARWNQQDATGIGDLYTADANVIGFDGSQMNGREEIVTTLASIFAHHKTATYIGKVREVRLLSETTALLRAVVSMIPPGGSDINPAVNAIQSLVAVKEGNRWKIALFHNTPAAFHGRPEANEALTTELRQLLPQLLSQ